MASRYRMVLHGKREDPAYYIEWHMREAWRELFADEDLHPKSQRDPVAPAERSASALQKMARRSIVSRPFCKISPPSCETPARRATPSPPRPPSRCSQRQPPRSTEHSACFKLSPGSHFRDSPCST